MLKLTQLIAKNLGRKNMLTLKEKELHLTLKKLVATERQTLIQIIEYLQVVYDTRLFAKLGHSSLIKYLIRELGYSEAAAYRRMQALKLTREIPVAKKMVKDGTLTLSNIAQVQTMLADKDSQTKAKAIKAIAGQSSTDAKKTLFNFAPEKEKIKRASQKKDSRETTRVSVSLSDTAMAKMDILKARTKCYELGELIELALDLALSATDVTKKRTNQTKKTTKGRTIAAKVKKAVYVRAEGRCEHPGCDEIHFLEYDHKTPVCQGGGNELSNIRLVCRAHNQLYAIEKLGMGMMGAYLSKNNPKSNKS